MGTGRLTISIDLELAWGIWDSIAPGDLERVESLERPICAALFKLFDRYEIPATWAVVAALLDESSAGLHGGPKACWFAPDVIAQLRRSTARHEIGSHSGRHIYFDQADADEAAADLEFVQSVHRAHGLPCESFVFPRGRPGHLDLIARMGLKTYNYGDVGWVELARRGGRRVGQAANLLDKLLPIPPKDGCPERHGPLIHIPKSMLLMGRNGLRRFAFSAVTRAKLRLGLDRAQRNGTMFHLWFHPSNFYYRTDEQLSTLEWFLALAAERASRGLIELRTMGSYAGEISSLPLHA